jgi:DNA polymerase beta
MNKNKDCPEGKVVNPITGRCINKETLDKQNKKKERDEQKKLLLNVLMPNNKKIIDNLKILADYERINKEPFKVKAYEKVIEAIELLDKDIEKLEDIKTIKGVGKKIEDKLIEFLNTGNITEADNAQNDPRYILGNKLKSIYGVGPAKINDLMAKIKDFDELKEHPELLNDKQRIGLKYYDDMNVRIPITEGRKHFKIVEKILKSMGKGKGNDDEEDIEFEFVGSYRRKNKDMGDIDILIKNKKGLVLKDIIKQLEGSGYIIEKLALGNNKFMGLCKLSPELPARRIDILIADPSHYYFALLYFTGSYSFNIHMRKIALKRGLSLSEYGFKDVSNSKIIIDTTDIIHSEEDIFKYLEMAYVEPSKR